MCLVVSPIFALIAYTSGSLFGDQKEALKQRSPYRYAECRARRSKRETRKRRQVKEGEDGAGREGAGNSRATEQGRRKGMDTDGGRQEWGGVGARRKDGEGKEGRKGSGGDG